jgi:hypothetical protein
VYDCFGAGQRVSQVTFVGASWRQDPGLAQQMFDAFAVMRRLHELLWHLSEARQLPAVHGFGDELRLVFDETSGLTRLSAEALLVLDLTPHWQTVNALLQRVSQAARASIDPPGPDYRGADLARANLRRADLRGANLRGACLIRADLSNATLALADVTGADLRDADLRGADLTESLFLTQAQLDAAIGSRETRIPSTRLRPAHWTRSSNVS